MKRSSESFLDFHLPSNSQMVTMAKDEEKIFQKFMIFMSSFAYVIIASVIT